MSGAVRPHAGFGPWGGLTSALRAVLIVAATGAGATAHAQDSPIRSHDSSQPIEINADSLEVQQDRQLAVFRGNVVAIQGEIRLRADTLRVDYKPREEGGGAAGAAATISRIEARGNVFMVSPGETAQGTLGVYDVENQLITMTGAVVLTRGENVVRGERLVLDLSTGRSKMESGTPSGQRDRVRALFVPPKKEAPE